MNIMNTVVITYFHQTVTTSISITAVTHLPNAVNQSLACLLASLNLIFFLCKYDLKSSFKVYIPINSFILVLAVCQWMLASKAENQDTKYQSKNEVLP